MFILFVVYAIDACLDKSSSSSLIVLKKNTQDQRRDKPVKIRNKSFINYVV